jgi:hypothetical protein
MSEPKSETGRRPEAWERDWEVHGATGCLCDVGRNCLLLLCLIILFTYDAGRAAWDFFRNWCVYRIPGSDEL